MENPISIDDLYRFDLYSYFYGLVSQIPRGTVSTYGSLARALGDVSASRACGYMLSINSDPENIPCYRVVKSDSSVWKFTHVLGINEKIRRLAADGIRTKDGKVENFEDVLFQDFDTFYPLAAMRRKQSRIADLVDLDKHDFNGEIGAVDVSYDDYFGYGSFVYTSGEEYHTSNVVLPVRFPYIPGYLANREFRFIETLCKGFKGTLLVDGNGYLHPLRAGLASMAGVLLDVQTIGVAKSIMFGNVRDNWIFSHEDRIGYIMNKSTVISAGHRTDLDSAVEFIRSLNNGGYPQILKMAHNATVLLRKESAVSVQTH